MQDIKTVTSIVQFGKELTVDNVPEMLTSMPIEFVSQTILFVLLLELMVNALAVTMDTFFKTTIVL
jgi:hypothetical protein